MANVIDDQFDFQAFVAERVKSGRYPDAHAVYQAAKTALLHEEADDELDLEYVRQALAEGEASGRYSGDFFADLRAKYNLPSQA